MRIVAPKRYSHCPRKAYTLRGFERRVLPRLIREHRITKRFADKLEQMYFPKGLNPYMDDTGVFRNTRRYRLYYLSRDLGKDRKRQLFDLVVKSQLFYVYYDDEGQVKAFVSPWVHRKLGVIPFERLAQL